MSDPVMQLVVGPNGSGKSTLYARVLEPITHLPFINADTIAEREWPGEGSAHAYEAAKMAAAERSVCVDERRSFASETVFSHRSKVELIGEAKAAGYFVGLHVCMIPVDLTVMRVEDRVAGGGHPVPEPKIRERYLRLWPLVVDGIGLADEAVVYDNSVAKEPFRLVAKYRAGRLVAISEWPTWAPPELRDAGL
jgi:predicted ABC-type ATPase